MAADPELPVRIVIEKPLSGVLLKLQRGAGELVAASSVSATRTVFDFAVRIGPPRAGGAPTFLGPFTQGPPAQRFVYINVGERAGQKNTPWNRRAKIPLMDITAAQVKQALAAPGSRLEVHVAGTSDKGEPVCASVRLPAGAWQVVRGRR